MLSLISWLAAAASVAVASASQTFYVSPSGSDSNPGTETAPFASLERAKSAVRASLRVCEATRCHEHLRDGEPSAEVVLQDGEWNRQASGFTSFVLDSQDSGPSPSNPVVWRAATAGRATVSGGLFVPQSAFKPWSAGPSGALVADIGSLGAPYTGNIISGGLKDCQHNMSSVSLDDGSIGVARWPNLWPNGTWRFDSIIAGGRSGEITVNSSRAAKWVAEPYPAIHGYWIFDWSDAYANISAVTPLSDGHVNLTITPATEVATHARYYGLNMLVELDDDINGEFYIDHDAKLLYLMPPQSATWSDKGVYVSFTESVIVLNGTSNVNITGVSVKHSKGTGVTVLRPSGVWLNDMVVSLHGANGTYMAGGSNSGVIGGTVSDCGCMGVSVTGGDLVSLAEGNMLVQGTTITRMGQWKRTYQAGLFWGGVNNVYRDLVISHGPHNGVLGGGNEAGGVNVLFDNLTISNVATEVSDSGAFYTCGQQASAWVNPGIVIQNSHFSDIRNIVPCQLGYPSVQAIYLDDLMSMHTIRNCTFQNVQKGVFIGGGRNTTVIGNTFRDVDVAVHIDNRGMGGESGRCDSAAGDCWQGLRYVNYEQPPWSTQFPQLQSFNDGRACVPEHNLVEGNTYCGGQFTDVSSAEAAAWGDTFAGNTGTNGTCSALRHAPDYK